MLAVASRQHFKSNLNIICGMHQFKCNQNINYLLKNIAINEQTTDPKKILLSPGNVPKKSSQPREKPEKKQCSLGLNKLDRLVYS